LNTIYYNKICMRIYIFNYKKMFPINFKLDITWKMTVRIWSNDEEDRSVQ